jgi:RNA polymerase sigma-70 factor (ECF subfamily)
LTDEPLDEPNPLWGAASADLETRLEAERKKWLDDFQNERRPILLTLMTRKLGDRGAAEDVIQDALLKVVRRWQTKPDSEVTFAWVFKVASNVANDRLRKARRNGHVLCGLIPDHGPSAAPDRAAYHAAETILASLHPRVSEAFLLCRVAGFSSAEVGSLMGIPASTVRSRVGEAVTALRQAVAGLTDLDEEGGTGGSR